MLGSPSPLRRGGWGVRRTLNDKIYTILKTVLTTAVLRLVDGGLGLPPPVGVRC